MLPITELMESADIMKRIRPLLSDGEAMLLARIADALLEEAAADEARSLGQKLLSFESTCQPSDIRKVRALLNLAGGSLATQIAGGDKRLMTVSAFQSIAHHFNPQGTSSILCRGSLKQSLPELFKNICCEAREERLSAVRRNYASVSPPGLHASEWINSELLAETLSRARLQVSPSGKATYVFYDFVGDFVRPHVDIDEFAFNVLLLVAHESVERRDSELILFGIDAAFATVSLTPGEFIVFDAARTFHGRRPVGKDERVAILTAGMVQRC